MRYRISLALIIAGALAACGSSHDAAESSQDEAAADSQAAPAEDAAPKLALLDACDLKMTQPESHEWKTKWDPAHIRVADENPSSVRSTHWADETELKSAHEMGAIIPLDLVCGNDDTVEPTVKFDITAFDSSLADVPLGPGTYRIAPKASPAKNKPGEFIVGVFLFNKAMFQATGGTLTLKRFDHEGTAGSFVIDGNEILTGSRPLHVEGTFDMPCRKGILQSGCASNAAEQPR